MDKLQYNQGVPIVANGGISNAQCDIYGDLLTTDSASYVNMTNSGLAVNRPGFLIGVIVNNHTNGTIRLWDNTVPAVTPITGVITFSAVATTGERFIPFWGAFFITALYVSLSSADITLVYN